MNEMTTLLKTKMNQYSILSKQQTKQRKRKQRSNKSLTDKYQNQKGLDWDDRNIPKEWYPNLPIENSNYQNPGPRK